MARKPKRSQRAYGEWAPSDKSLEQKHNFREGEWEILNQNC